MPALDPIPGDVGQAVAAGAVLWALLQAILASWRDLAPVTIGIAGCALLLGPDALYHVGAVVLALVVSALAEARAARHGVGRPALVMLAVAGVTVGGLLPVWGPALLPDADPGRLRAVGLMPCMVAGAIGGVLALERPGIRPRPPRWVGRIPIEPQRSP